MELDQFRHASPPSDADELRASPIGKPDKPFVVLLLGALEKRKGLRRFLPTFGKVVSERPNTVLLVAGEGEEKDSIEHDITELTLRSHVRMLGFRNDPQSLLAISDALVICSEREGFPRVVVQAGLAGVPIISTPLPGIDKIVRNNETGLVGLLQDFDKMLLRLIDEPEVRRSMSDKLLALDYSPWDVNTMTAKTEKAYLANAGAIS
jgi:glycosyltransferase involved in cell wall biosynthesis